MVTYPLKTYLLVFKLCITLFICNAQNNTESDTLVSDTTKLGAFLKLSPVERFNKIKIPIIKKDSKKVFWTLPSIAWNNYDKTQLGLMLGVEKGNFDLLATPMYGTGSKNLTGILKSSYNLKTDKLYNTTFSLNAKRFTYLLFPEDLSFNVISPSINFQPKIKVGKKLSFGIKSTSIWQEYVLNGRKTTYFYLNTLNLSHSILNKKFNNSNTTYLNQGKQFATLHNSNKFSLYFNKKKENSFYLSSFLGIFLYNKIASTNIDAPSPIFQLSGSTNSGIYWLQKDYAFNDFYLDRNAQDNFLQKQVADSEGGFKSLTSIGNAKQFMFALNLRSDVVLPKKLKRIVNVQPFMNFAIAKNKNIDSEIYFEAGTSLLFFNEFLAFHIPFATTNNIKSNQATVYGIQSGDWPKRITFSLDIMRIINGF